MAVQINHDAAPVLATRIDWDEQQVGVEKRLALLSPSLDATVIDAHKSVRTCTRLHTLQQLAEKEGIKDVDTGAVKLWVGELVAFLPGSKEFNVVIDNSTLRSPRALVNIHQCLF